MTGNNIQLDKTGNLKHFLSIEGLNKPYFRQSLTMQNHLQQLGKDLLKKYPYFEGKP